MSFAVSVGKPAPPLTSVGVADRPAVSAPASERLEIARDPDGQEATYGEAVSLSEDVGTDANAVAALGVVSTGSASIVAAPARTGTSVSFASAVWRADVVDGLTDATMDAALLAMEGAAVDEVPEAGIGAAIGNADGVAPTFAVDAACDGVGALGCAAGAERAALADVVAAAMGADSGAKEALVANEPVSPFVATSA